MVATDAIVEDCAKPPCTASKVATDAIVKDCAEPSCTASKARGNAAYADGDLSLAAECYVEAIELWEAALAAVEQPQVLKVGTLVRYDKRGFFAVVMSAFAMFDEYFLKDLGSDKPIWEGEPGGDLRRFARKDLQPATRDLLDLRLAVAQNLAAVRLKQGELTEAVRWADAALVISGRSPKALMRKGAALLRLSQPGRASDVLATAAEVTPGDLEVRQLLREAEARRSPAWVCVTGCCGPWGIVCGGPIASTSTAAQVVPPAKKPAVKDGACHDEGCHDEGCQDEGCQDSAAAETGELGEASEATAADADAGAEAELATADLGTEVQAEGVVADFAAQEPVLSNKWRAGPAHLRSGGKRLWMGTAGAVLLAAMAATWVIGEAGSGFAGA